MFPGMGFGLPTSSVLAKAAQSVAKLEGGRSPSLLPEGQQYQLRGREGVTGTRGLLALLGACCVAERLQKPRSPPT